MGDAAGSWAEDLDLIRAAASAAGEVAMGFFGKSPEVWYKNENRSPVSAADFAANEKLAQILRAARPNYGWLSEETEDDAARLGCETLFVVDPIDGTRAFIAGLDTWCVSVAVVHRAVPVAGVLVAPALGEDFWAAAGAGAWKNGKAISVSAPVRGARLQLAAPEDIVSRFEPGFRAGVERIRHVPSLAYRLAMIADGRIDGTLVKKNSHDWDLAAADIILAEAGGQLVGLEGRPLAYNRETVAHDTLCAASAEVLPHLLANLTRI
ncbi:3'(2'),5'-bisphosphate nucleotidase CysQ [Rhizobium sp. YJ-22]|uniref:3'(2'),5'-bisphosphate nucleotidase CysQ n=1 Tax=Rhizobium sp. YJ-22 TaxID=3037556 RepID=UPI00241223FF|nr:3'(2'),5'-bisphosphate nucleotidase CysQ [Rhizobium sp. YJ-22]MDG3575062.1 3'(2'),5'-bisphosphate nucleotidase CysQ [Rhizobium sp. YJ-22]